MFINLPFKKKKIYENDPCHKFAWCLDACVGDNSRETVEIRRIKEIENLLQQIPSGSPLIGDLSMIMADCFAVNSFIRNIFITLVDIVNHETTPKVCFFFYEFVFLFYFILF